MNFSQVILPCSSIFQFLPATVNYVWVKIYEVAPILAHVRSIENEKMPNLFMNFDVSVR